jgi:hypothetical protein
MSSFNYAPDPYPWFNTTDYTIPQLILFAVAALYWVWVYIVVIRDIVKNKFIGIPILAICANFAWELLWSVKFCTNMGLAFEWGYRAWFLLDLFIFYSMFKYGKIQFSNPILHKNFTPIVFFAFMSWIAGIYALTIEFYDPIGATSAYLVNVHMSAIYILLILQFPNEKTLSVSTAVHKMLGTALTTVFCFWVFSDQYFMLTLGVITFILDCAYIFLIKKIRASQATT